MNIKRLGIITSGGDCPGMNPAIFGIFSACKEHNIECLGFIGGYDGLINMNYVKIDYQFLEGKINAGGSMIKCGRSKSFKNPKVVKSTAKKLIDAGITNLIVIGGDGSTRGAMDLNENGINVNCLPGTIDNDLNFTYTLGFNTALDNIVNAVDNISNSISSFGYGAVIKIMGRDCPDLVDNSALALYTPYVIKTADFNLNNLVKAVKNQHSSPDLPPIVLVLENVVDVTELAKTLQEKTKFNWRPHILGYIQRGGKPSAFDRNYGYSAGKMAVEELIKGNFGYMIGIDGAQLTAKLLKNCFKQ